jgi:hypothetical protein
MPARDGYHEIVKRALVKDGWTITHDPLHLPFEERDLFVDLGAERVLGAVRGEQRIAVEIKGFGGASAIADLQRAVGQYVMYHDVMAELEPGRQLYLALDQTVFVTLFSERLGRLLVRNGRLLLLVFDAKEEVILRWVP